MSEADVLAAMSWKPARSQGWSTTGCRWPRAARPTLCVVDPSATWTIDDTGGASRSRNVPYVGRTVRGRVRHTILFGEHVVIDGEAQR